MFGGSRFRTEIYITDATGQHPRAVTDLGGGNVDPSWSPDGNAIVFSGCPRSFCRPSDHEIYTVPVSGSTPTRLTRDDFEDNDPYFSHDGKQLAWLTKVSGRIFEQGSWDIRVAGPDGQDPRRLINDDNVNSKPAWSLDDRTIYFHRAVAGSNRGFQLWSVNVDGTHLTELTARQPGQNEFPGT
jgi:TolB protein